MTQLIEQYFRVLQVGGVEAFGEPAVNFTTHCVCLLPMPLFRQQTRQTRCCAQLPSLRAHAPS